VNRHLLDIDADGVTTATHPEDDVQDCGFDAYVAADWEGPTVPRTSRWEFLRSETTAGVVWSGTRVDQPVGPS